MSYDLRVWVTDPRAAETHATHAENRKGRGWQIVVSTPVRVEQEDIPDAIRDALPGIAMAIELNLEPIDAPKSALLNLQRLARRIAKLVHGVVEDPQRGELETPRGVRRFLPDQMANCQHAILTLTWWFTTPMLDDPQRIEAFLNNLSQQLPETLPKRYGLYEPPQHRLKETGRGHLQEYLLTHLFDVGGVVWYPHAPVRHLHLGLFEKWGATKRGYRANYFKVDVDAAVLGQPGWQTQLKRFWRSVPSHLQPFYGDVRLLSGLARSGRDDHDGERHPICGPWFAGVPTDLPLAMVVGPTFARLWPGIQDCVDAGQEFVFVEVDNWADGGNIASITGPVPSQIAQQSPGYADKFGPNLNRSYPKAWPLGAIVDEAVW